MKKTFSILIYFVSLFHFYGQEVRNDDLGDVTDNFQNLFFKALEQKGIENYEKAIVLLNKCNTINPNNAAINFELGKNYYETNNFTLAENTFKKADSLKPNNIWILESLYKLYNASINNEKVIETLQKLQEISPLYEEKLLQFYIKVNEDEKAIALIDKLDKKGFNKNREDLRHQIYSSNGSFKKQIKFIENKISNKTANEDDFIRLTYVYSKTKKQDKSFETAILFTQTYPKSDIPHLSLYKFYLNENDIDNATKSMFRVLKSNTLKESNKSRVINDFFNYTKQNKQYLPELEKAISIYPTIEIRSKIALFYNQNNNKKGNQYIKSVTKNNATSFDDLKLLGTVFLKDNRIEDALENSKKALSLFPAQPIFYLQQAKAYNRNKQGQKAIDSLEFGLDYLIDNLKMRASFYNEMSKAYELLKNNKKKDFYLQKAKKISKQL